MYEYEGTRQAKIHDELTLPENYSMEDIKSRVKSCLDSPMGSEYVMEVVHERHIILSKSKHDMRVCCAGTEIPIKISIYRLGELEKSSDEYISLKNSIHTETVHGGPPLEY